MGERAIGLDVGGTFTDAVLLNGVIIESAGKISTDAEDILGTVLKALDSLEVKNTRDVKKITVSTTLVTNAIVQNKLPPVELVLFPGSGMPLEALSWPVRYHTLSGEMDYRGRVVREPNRKEWRHLLAKLQKLPYTPRVCVVGKFSHRNKAFEEQLAVYLRENLPAAHVTLGSQWGQVNFYRRSLTAYLDLATRSLFDRFSAGLQQAIRARGYQAPITVLKADGGVLPITKVRPVQTIYSGPAASVLGALAQTECRDTYVVADIGGTTTDIGAVLSGVPLISGKGAQIGTYMTNVRSLAVRAVPVGGDSVVTFCPDGADQGAGLRGESGKDVPDGSPACGGWVILAGHRDGPAYCLGGPSLTPTDALRYLNLSTYGDRERAEEALRRWLPADRRQPEDITDFAEAILSEMTATIHSATRDLLREWEEEPAYRVWEVLHQEASRPIYLHLSGGGAADMAEVFARRFKMRVNLAPRAEMANAIGSALARPAFSSTLHLDTHLGHYRIEETGEQGAWTGSKRPQAEVGAFLRASMECRAADMGLDISTLDIEEGDFYFFPLVENYQTTGQIVQGSMHIPAGVTGRMQEE